MDIVNQEVTYKTSLIPWTLIRLSLFTTLYVPFSDWAINAESIGKYDLGLSILFVFTHILALYGSVVVAFTSLILAVFYNVKNLKGDEVLLYSFFISICPISYIIIMGFIK